MKLFGHSSCGLCCVGCVFVVLLLLILGTYSNTFSVSWKLDDLPNIVKNPRLQLETLSIGSLNQAFYARPNGGTDLYRPVACLSFALNWYFGRDDVFGYHLVNLAVHLLTAFLLYLTLMTLHRTPRLTRNFETSQAHFIALLAAILWAVCPVQTQAVNYIVQRMATMAALFSILGIFFYTKARLCRSEYRRGMYFIACAAAFLLALGSKENAVLMLLSLVLIEFVFFQKEKKLWKNQKLVSVALLAIGSVIGVAYMFYDLNPFFFLNGYGNRPFTLSERVLTETRVLVFYLSQFLFPHPNRLSITHDFDLSRGLLQPWTTLGSILLICLLIGLSIVRMRRYPIASFACLFFFMNHLVESTVIPLELVFEHRNYLPSLFLFWPVAAGFHYLLVRLQSRKHLYYGIIAVMPMLVLSFAGAAYLRNETWKSNEIFWQDAIRKAPGYKRPYQQLATYYQNHGQLDKAIVLLEQSRELTDENPRVGRIVYYNNMGDILIQKGRYKEAIEYLETLLAVEPNHRLCRGNLIVAQMKSGQWSRASANIDYLMRKRYNNYLYPNLKGVVLVRMNQLPEAYRYFRQALEMDPLARVTLVNFCTSISLLGEFDRAQTCLTRAMEFHPEDRSLLIRLADNRIHSGNLDAAFGYLDRLDQGADVAMLQLMTEEAENIYQLPPSDLLISMVEKDTWRISSLGKSGIETDGGELAR